MSVWDDRFKDHAAHQQLADALAAVRKVKVPPEGTEATEARGRLERALAHVKVVLAGADPELTPVVVLDTLSQQLPGLTQQVELAAGEVDPSYLNNASNHMDQILQAVAGVIRLVAPEDVERLQEAATTYRQSVGQLLRHVREEAKQVEAEVTQLRTDATEIRTEMDAQKGRLDQALADYQEGFATEQRDHETRFAAAQEEQAEAMRVARTETERRVEEIATQSNNHIDELTSGLKGKGEESLKRLDKLEADAKRQVDVIAVVGMSGGYQQVADKEEKQANRWRLFAAGSAAAAIVLNVVLVLLDVFGWLDERFEWEHQVPRVLVTLSLLAFASYAGVESSRHRHRQEDNRRMEKELASLEPYLALFSDEEKKNLKKSKFDIFFQGRNARRVERADDSGEEPG